MPALPVVGLTGGIGSGKSAAADRFAELGITVVDTDRVAHGLTAVNGAAMPAIRASFGDGVLGSDGALDRAAMRRLVFADPAQRLRLQAILHPLIRSAAEAELSVAGGSYALLVVPLLVDSGPHYRERCARIVVVDCPEAVQIARVMQRSGLSETEVRAIMDSQASRAERLAIADDVIDNGGDFVTLRAQVDTLHAAYVKTWG
ncbi:dephospho-CoA kinase [Uliginosibacterium sp. H1]|uniref:dephospho-CoA kinase n=1 Tax=Uliginosibacterium sp. H1 TaxID=3114757 RepID=UPI002E194DB5|nr:dephospho-CoA kinase [Uliginosibacterium sp. H1]MEC5399271.1 dephospho-CoA kinase [Uliginosibacterium sp. H1]